MVLDWPSETVLAEDKIEQWHQPVSNRVLDFHGDPIKANLVVFSDGNHHMALLQSLQTRRSSWHKRQLKQKIIKICKFEGFERLIFCISCRVQVSV